MGVLRGKSLGIRPRSVQVAKLLFAIGEIDESIHIIDSNYVRSY